MTPNDVLFTQTHEWVKKDGPVATVGISEFAVHQLSDLVYISLPKVGTAVKAGAPLGEVESVKTVSDILAPLNGEVIEVNNEVTSNLDTITKDPYGAGWLVKIKMTNPADLTTLLSQEAYNKLCEAES